MHRPKVFDARPSTLDLLSWQRYSSDGRHSVEIVPLYDTTIVKHKGSKAALLRYGAGATVLPHKHPGFELIHVISGVLEDDHGVYGPGSCIVFEPSSVHGLHSKQGCVFLVVWEEPVEPISPATSTV